MTPENLRIEGLTVRQLDALLAAIAQRREYLVFEERKQLRQRLIDEAAKEGFTIQELFGVGGGATRQRGVSEKPRLVSGTYADPGNPNRQWSGRGRMPRWFKAALSAGTPAVAMRVDDAAG